MIVFCTRFLIISFICITVLLRLNAGGVYFENFEKRGSVYSRGRLKEGGFNRSNTIAYYTNCNQCCLVVVLKNILNVFIV